MPTNGGIIGPVNLPVGNKITSVTSSTNFTRDGQNIPDTAPAVLVVAGGGGGQNNSGNGGAGAGGFRISYNHPLPASAVPVTIGAGGAKHLGSRASGNPIMKYY